MRKCITTISKHVFPILSYRIPAVLSLSVSWHFCEVRRFLDTDPLGEIYLHRKEGNYIALMLFSGRHALILPTSARIRVSIMSADAF
jgi:hypothetical protein